MAATSDLAAVTRFALERGGQRPAGRRRPAARRRRRRRSPARHPSHRPARVTLTEVVRFRDQAEAAATLALRDGDTDRRSGSTSTTTASTSAT